MPPRTSAEESYGADCVRVNDHVLAAEGFPKLVAEVRTHGFNPRWSLTGRSFERWTAASVAFPCAFSRRDPDGTLLNHIVPCRWESVKSHSIWNSDKPILRPFDINVYTVREPCQTSFAPIVGPPCSRHRVESIIR